MEREIEKIMRRLDKICTGTESKFELKSQNSDDMITLVFFRTTPEGVNVFYKQASNELKNRKDQLNKFNAQVEIEQKKFEPEMQEKIKKEFETKANLQRKQITDRISQCKETMRRLKPFYKGKKDDNKTSKP